MQLLAAGLLLAFLNAAAAAELWPQMERRWLSTKLREKRFDVASTGERR